MVSASRGDWEHAIAELRRLVATTAQPGVMSLLARSALARLLARIGDPGAAAVLAEAWRDPASGGDSFVAGPLAAAQAEVDWLAGTARPAPAVLAALALAAESGHSTVQAEVCGYLRRAGHDVAPPADAPGPWGEALAGRSRAAASAWQALGERYEQAVELALCGDEAGLAMLTDLGAVATLARVSRPRSAADPDR
jgi:hypothetical protein